MSDWNLSKMNECTAIASGADDIHTRRDTQRFADPTIAGE